MISVKRNNLFCMLQGRPIDPLCKHVDGEQKGNIIHLSRMEGENYSFTSYHWLIEMIGNAILRLISSI